MFLACQHLHSGTNLSECEDQSWFKVQAVPVFRFEINCVRVPPKKSSTILDISLKLLSNNDGSVGIACSSPLNIFIHVIPEDGQYRPKHVVSIIRA
jgi:hypothetical protein